MAGLKKTRIKEKKERKQIKKEKPCGEKSVAFKSGKPCKRGLYIRISFFLENAFICHWCMYCRNGSDRLTVSTEMETACHCADRHVFALPAFILDTYKKMYEQKRFADAATYMEQMLYAFQKTGKVLSALKEARETFEPGHMRDIMDESIGHLEAGHSYSEKSVLMEP